MQHTVSLSELIHDSVSLFLDHVAVHRRDGEVGLAHFFSEPVDLSASVAEDNGLSDSERVVKIAQCIEFPVFFLDSDEELLDALESQLVTFDQNANGILYLPINEKTNS